ncbi:unnamed protein product [Pseudo-nitzschia multistriata]|uniref:Histone-lysine N-methyltransferase, H3 lysine-79 specific n=1 Tax=Pseudo-nitzschia multistriata TaxID=183589 RepID=A0A448Z2E0_9STRA|nr:unnamed protein product [Pseudo-nitzschia multistriata]
MEDQFSVGFQASLPCDPLASFSCLVVNGQSDRTFTLAANVLPVTANCNSNLERWHRNDLILGRFWQPEDGIDEALFESKSEEADHLKSQPHYLTYGEVTALGVRQLAYEMGIANCDGGEDRRNRFDDANAEYNYNEDDGGGIVFYDLGSGVGRLVTQMYIDQPDRVEKSVGIELSEGRHEIGINALKGIIGEDLVERFDGLYSGGDAMPHFPIELIHGDATEVVLDTRTTHVYISSLCFPKNVLLTIQEILLKLPKIRVIAALNRLDTILQLEGEEWQERNVPIQMSWGPSTAKLYRKVKS